MSDQSDLSIDFTAGPYGVVKWRRRIIAYLPEGARIGIPEVIAIHQEYKASMDQTALTAECVKRLLPSAEKLENSSQRSDLGMRVGEWRYSGRPIKREDPFSGDIRSRCVEVECIAPGGKRITTFGWDYAIHGWDLDARLPSGAKVKRWRYNSEIERQHT